MPSAFESDFFDGGWNVLATTHGESCIITPSGGSPQTVLAFFHRGVMLDSMSGRGNFRRADQARVREFGVLVVPPEAMTAWTPSANDTVVINGITYEVDEVGPQEPGISLQLVANNYD